MNSLAARLVLGTTLAVTAALGVAGWTLRALVRGDLVAQLDGDLERKARLLASLVEQEGQHLDLEFDELDMSEFTSPAQGGYLQVWTHDGETLYRSPSLAQGDLPRPSPASLAPAWLQLPGDVPGRAVGLEFRPRQERAGVAPTTVCLVLARDATGLQASLASLDRLMLAVGLLTLLISGLALTLAVRHSLRPLARVSSRIGSIGVDSLAERLDAGEVPRELRPVVERVNELLARLETAFSRERAFSNDVAHELRTPLAGLRTTLEVTASRPRQEAEYAQALRTSSQLVEQLQAMVDRLLHLARLEAGSAGLGQEVLDLTDLAVDAWEPFTGRAADRELDVNWALDPDLHVSSDRELLGLILRNLYENAVDYADRGGTLRVEGRTDPEGVRLTVANSGSALSQEQAEQATQRFWRGDSARTQAGLHCGLGLALVQRAARALDVSLKLSSNPGGEFQVVLTLPKGRAARPAQRVPVGAA